jgi:hypothetical protein
MDIQWDRQTATDRIRPACLVPGCSCKDPRIISSRRVAFFHVWAKEHGETADRVVEPDPDWAFAPPLIQRRATIG